MPDCKTCKENRATVPYIVHESEMARKERTEKRLWIVILVLIVCLVGSNLAWAIYESQFETIETESTDVTQEVDQFTGGGGSNTFVGGDYHGAAEMPVVIAWAGTRPETEAAVCAAMPTATERMNTAISL